MLKPEYFLTIRPLLTAVECGDAGIIKESDGKIFLGIVDVLGHGADAYKIAMTARDFFEKQYRRSIVDIISALHTRIKGSRGAVVALCRVDLRTGELEYTGVGNITARIFGAVSKRLVPRDGIIGYVMPTPRVERMTLSSGDVVMLYTDGVQEHFELEDYPKLLHDDAETIGRRVIRQFGKPEDDAACIVLKYREE